MVHILKEHFTFDTVWREEAIYELPKAGVNNNLLSVFCSFLSDRYSRNLVNNHILVLTVIVKRGYFDWRGYHDSCENFFFPYMIIACSFLTFDFEVMKTPSSSGLQQI